MREVDQYKDKHYIGRNARLLNEWIAIDERYMHHPEVSYIIRKRNAEGLPVVYEIIFNIKSFCGVSEPDEQGLQHPLLHDEFVMRINIPNNYPSIDSKLEFKFLTKTHTGIEIAHPWHPNIRYFGDFAGLVCLNTNACGSYTDLAFYINRVISYLKYEKYHALNTPPYPQDNKVAEWVLEQGEPQHWIENLQALYTPQK